MPLKSSPTRSTLRGRQASIGCIARLGSGLSTVPLLFTAGGVSAAEWVVSPSLRGFSEYVDNPRMFSQGGESVTGTVGEMFGSVDRFTERSRLSFEPRVLVARYTEDDSLDNDIKSMSTQYDYRWERTRFSLSGGYTLDTTLTSEIGRTGLIEATRDHEGLSLSLGPTFTLTERTSVGGQLSASKNHYRNARNTGLLDYGYHAASLFSQYDYSENIQITLTAHGGQLQVNNAPLADKQDAALRLGMTYQSSEHWVFDASVGPSYTKSEFSSDQGAVYQVGMRRPGERWSLNAGLSRDVTPTGQGVLTRSDQVNWGVERYFTERLRGGFSLFGVRNEDQLQQRGTRAPRLEYARADLTLNWQMAEHWSLSLAIGAATQKYTSNPDSGASQRASIGIVWNGQQRSL